MSKLVIMAGGTGGHVFPGLAVAHKMQTMGWLVEWMGTADKMEAQLVPKHNIPIHFIHIGGVRGKGIITKLRTPFLLLQAFLEARALLKEIKPDIVLGMGGYASGPGGLAAKSLGIPLVIHEQNAIFGMTNRYLAKFAKVTMTGFDTHGQTLKSKAPPGAVFVGNPIRESFFDVPPLDPKSNKAPHILIVGGSLGALALNQDVPKILCELNKKIPISALHQTGKGKCELVKQLYATASFVNVDEFIDNMSKALAQADIVICRAGALTVAEVAAAGRPAIFVPLPIAVDDHQTANAKSLSDSGAAILLPQLELPEQLFAQLENLCVSPEKRSEIGAKARAHSIANATTKVADILLELTSISREKDN